ncbi:Rossmann-like and DUF2520 domain-containing protein [Aquimarina gracilis]|uniref:Rossmann-like and DUF2520 domain-containing protein n=1 Tax=Aquimarina gracilis TaxID=874422 RepID=A0ABU5ZW16_9FLAO|nr:Rossmann-like and DUF2520 domain-containing protein [Aquimarina gracilis]MEB3346051.1 Rossmann-like and DUF2520 domain-containing protein [Aquimarina gracilis]
MIRVVILGAGNVAQHLYAAFLKQKSINVIQCYNRKGVLLHPNQNKNTITQDINLLKEADIYVLAVSDDAIKKVALQLPFKGKLVVHTSGSVPIEMLDNSNKKGVFYPLQTFSKDKDVDFSTVPFCLEAENEDDLKLLKDLAGSLSKKVYKISSEQRNVLHVSAVFVNNFTNHLFSVGNDICQEHNIPFEILHPLILETTNKITKMPPSEAQTGPAIRKDNQTIERHLNILSHASQKELYKILTKAIQSKYGKKL